MCYVSKFILLTKGYKGYLLFHGQIHWNNNRSWWICRFEFSDYTKTVFISLVGLGSLDNCVYCRLVSANALVNQLKCHRNYATLCTQIKSLDYWPFCVRVDLLRVALKPGPPSTGDCLLVSQINTLLGHTLNIVKTFLFSSLLSEQFASARKKLLKLEMF